MEAQTKLWQQEATELAQALSLDSAYARDLEPAAKAEAIVMEASRRQSSTMSQSEEPEEVPDTDKVGDNDNDDDFTIVTSIKNFCNFNNAKDNSDKSEPSTPMPLKKMKRRSFPLKIPRLSHLDFDTSRILISAYIALFRIQTDPEQSLSQCLRMFRELQTMSHVTAASLYETVNVIIERKIELDQLCLFQNEVDTAIQLVEKRLNDEQGEGVARFYLNKVLYAEYKEANATINPIPTISSLKLDDNPVTTSSSGSRHQ